MHRTILVFIIAVGLCASGLAQTPSDVKDGKVAVVGENPGIRHFAVLDVRWRLGQHGSAKTDGDDEDQNGSVHDTPPMSFRRGRRNHMSAARSGHERSADLQICHPAAS
jgi:hypothetical protein